MSPDVLLFIYVVVLLGAVAMAAVYSEFRSRRFRPDASQDRVFRCEKCGFVYTDDADVDRSRCSQCGSLNMPIEF
jgi:protein-arginine kinase activator protein McsA